MNMPTVIITNRLHLRPFQIGDADDVLEYASDTEYGKYEVKVPQPFTLNDAREFVARFSNPQQLEEIKMLAMVLGNKVIGQVYLNLLDPENERAELAWMLSKALWGQGFTTEAAKAILDWGFQNLKLNKIYARCDFRNVRSVRVMEKLGMKREGLLRCNSKWLGQYIDELYYGILRREWEK